MESTHEFVQNLQERQKKNEKSKKHHGQGNPSSKLPNKQHQQSN